MKKLNHLVGVLHDLHKVAPEKTVKEQGEWIVKHSDAIDLAFQSGESVESSDVGETPQQKCYRDHAGECGLCTNGVFLPCN